MFKFNLKKIFLPLTTLFLIILIVIASVLSTQSSASSHLILENKTSTTSGLNEAKSKVAPDKDKMLPLSKNTNFNSHLSSDDKIVRVITLPSPNNDNNDLIFVMTESNTSDKFNTFKLFDSVDGGKNFENTIANDHGLTGSFQIAYPHTNFFADINHDLFLNVDLNVDPGSSHSLAEIYCLQYDTLTKTSVSKFKFHNISPTSDVNYDINYVTPYSAKNNNDLAISNIYFFIISGQNNSVWTYDITAKSMKKIAYPGKDTVKNYDMKIFRDGVNWRVFLMTVSDNKRYLYYYSYNLSSDKTSNKNQTFTNLNIQSFCSKLYPPYGKLDISLAYIKTTLFISVNSGEVAALTMAWYAVNRNGSFTFKNLNHGEVWTDNDSAYELLSFNNTVYLIVEISNPDVSLNHFEIWSCQLSSSSEYKWSLLKSVDEDYSFVGAFVMSGGIFFDFHDTDRHAFSAGKYYLYQITKDGGFNHVLTSSTSFDNVITTNVGTYITQTGGGIYVAYNSNPTNFELLMTVSENASTSFLSVLQDNESLYIGSKQTLYTQFSATRAFRSSDSSMTLVEGSDNHVYYSFKDNNSKIINPDMTYFNKTNATFNKTQYTGGKLTLATATEQNAGIDILNISTNVNQNPDSIKTYNFMTEISAWSAISINADGYDHYFNDPNLVTNVNNETDPIISAWNDKAAEANSSQFQIETKPGMSLLDSHYNKVKFINNKIIVDPDNKSFNNTSTIFDPGIYKVHIADLLDNQPINFIVEIGYSNQQIPFKINSQNWQKMKTDMNYDGITTNASYKSTKLYLPFNTTVLNNFETFLYKYGYNVAPNNIFSNLSKKIKDQHNFSPDITSIKQIISSNNLNISNVANFAKSSINIETFFSSSKLWSDYSSKIVSEYIGEVKSQIKSVQQDATLFNIKNPDIGSGINNSAQLNSYLTFVKDYKSAVEQKAKSWLSSSECKAYQNLVTLGWGVNEFQYKPILSTGSVATLPFTWNSNLTVSQAINKYYSIDKLKLEYKTEADNEFAIEHPNNLQKTPELYQKYQIKKIEDSIDTHGHSLIDILNYAKIGTSKFPKPINKAQLLNYHDQKSYQQYLQIESDNYNYDLSDHSKTPSWIYEILIPIAGVIFIAFFAIFLVFALRRNSRKIAEREKYQRQYAQRRASGMQGFRNPNSHINQRKRIRSPRDKDPIVVTPIKVKKEKSKSSNLEVNGKRLLTKPINGSKPQVSNAQNKQSKINKTGRVVTNKTISNINKKQIQKTTIRSSSSKSTTAQKNRINSKKTSPKFSRNSIESQGQNVHNLLLRKARQQKNNKH